MSGLLRKKAGCSGGDITCLTVKAIDQLRELIRSGALIPGPKPPPENARIPFPLPTITGFRIAEKVLPRIPGWKTAD